jgi:hypothetical protein
MNGFVMMYIVRMAHGVQIINVKIMFVNEPLCGNNIFPSIPHKRGLQRASKMVTISGEFVFISVVGWVKAKARHLFPSLSKNSQCLHPVMAASRVRVGFPGLLLLLLLHNV